MKSNNWTKEETIIAFNVYCKVPFKSSSKNNPVVIEYANIIGRSPSALNMKVGNFGRLDPELKKLGITGLVNGSKLEEDVWNEFHGNWEMLAFKSEELIAEFQNKKIEEVLEIDLANLPEGKERETLIKARVNQSFFRSTVLASYNQKCCITGLSIPELLAASHIVPWKSDAVNRLNPHNGLCLNSIHHIAFDEGYITITPDYKIKISKYFGAFNTEKVIKDFFVQYDNQNMLKPDRFLPSREFLEYHYLNIFIK